MEEKHNFNPAHRNISSRDGVRVPSREKFDQSARKTFTQMNSSQQNFLRTSATFSDNTIASSADDLMLSSVNIAIDETGFVATLKSDVMQLQEGINKLDVDGSIRGKSTSELLKKNHIYAMHKFLTKYSGINIKRFMEGKLAHANQCDLENLLKFMSVRNGSEGIRKLYKLMTILDVMLLKLTEYQTVAFLKYDKVHEDIRQQLNIIGVNKNSTMDTGINPSRFQVGQAIVDRMFELYEFVRKLQQNSGTGGLMVTGTNLSSPAVKSLRSLDELESLLKSGEHLGLPGEIVISLLQAIQKSSSTTGKDPNARAQKEADRMVKYHMVRATELEKELQTQNQDKSDLQRKIARLEEELSEKDADMKNTMKNHQEQTDRRNSSQGSSSELEQQVKRLREENDRLSMSEKQLKEESRRFNSLETRLRDDITKLSDSEKALKKEVEDLKKQLASASKNSAEENSSNSQSFHPMDSQNPEYYINLVKDLEKNYEDKIAQLQTQNDQLEKQAVEMKIRHEQAVQESDFKSQEVSELEKRLSKLQNKKEDSYENALREETEMMKKGFENRIKKLQEDVVTAKREKANEIVDLRANLQREREGRELLLRKLQIYSKT